MSGTDSLEQWREHARKAYQTGAEERPGETTAAEMEIFGPIEEIPTDIRRELPWNRQ